MTKYQQIELIRVDVDLIEFIEVEVLPELNISKVIFWKALSELINELGPINKNLLAVRDEIQCDINQWNKQNKSNFNASVYKEFLNKIGYLKPEGADFRIETENVDYEISSMAGPQLVVPVSNARFALNAANARWGSLYDAINNTDVLKNQEFFHHKLEGMHNKAVSYGRFFLDKYFPLEGISHYSITHYKVEEGKLIAQCTDDKSFQLTDNNQFIGYQGNLAEPSAILLKHNNLHISIEIDKLSGIGNNDSAGIKDISIESALTTIQDFEDSVVAVNTTEKLKVYKNWLGLMKGDLSETIHKNGQEIERTLNPDLDYKNKNGELFQVHGRSLLICRNVGHLMTTPIILDKNNNEAHEGIIDAFISTVIALYDVNKINKYRNSRNGNVYIVKPKMHGPDEAAFTNTLFNNVEDKLKLPRNTIKLGIMDEERRTSVNLKECIRVVKQRIVFINTGFLDRTGDEIHTSMMLGPVVPKSSMKSEKWIQAYEKRNVDIGLNCGFSGIAQIGKGMWAMPDKMSDMMREKINHLKEGANTSWVPSPVAATLHALHYHEINVADVQEQLKNRPKTNIDEILSIPLLNSQVELSETEIENELYNNVQGILGYVVRWIDLGVGASKVPNINNVGLMEDRATLRISSQHICNWLEHGVLTNEQVMAAFEKMAVIVDEQNSKDPNYKKMSEDYEKSFAYKAALDLVFKGASQANGYTEPLLHNYRKQFNESKLSKV